MLCDDVRGRSRTCGLFDAADDERISNSLVVLTLVALMKWNQTIPWLLLGTFQRSFPSDIIQQQKPKIFIPSSSHKQELLIVSTFYTLNSKTHNSKSILSLYFCINRMY